MEGYCCSNHCVRRSRGGSICCTDNKLRECTLTCVDCYQVTIFANYDCALESKKKSCCDSVTKTVELNLLCMTQSCVDEFTGPWKVNFNFLFPFPFSN